MIAREMKTIEYTVIADDTPLIAAEAEQELAMNGRMCTVIRHRARTCVDYLIELPNGERRWVAEMQE